MVCYVAEQADGDTPNIPQTGGTFYVKDPPTVEQEPIIAENQELTNTLGKRAGKVVGHKIGSAKLNVNLKMSGEAGTLSNLHPLLYSLFGNFTQSPGVSVAYTHYALNQDLVFLTILINRGFESELIESAVVVSGSMKVSAENAVTLSLDLLFKKVNRASTAFLKSAIDGSSTPVTAIELEEPEDAKGYDVGAYITVGSNTNGGAGFKITAVNETSGVLTIESGVDDAQPIGAKVEPWAPVPMQLGENLVADFGKSEEVHGPTGVKEFGFTEAGYELKNTIKGLDSEVNWQGLVNHIKNTDDRAVSLNSTRYWGFDEQVLDYLRKNHVKVPVTLYVGNQPGHSLELSMPDVRFKKASRSGNDAVKAGINGECYEVNGNDESTLTLK